MRPRTDTELAYFIQGFFEITGSNKLSEEQAERIASFTCEILKKDPLEPKPTCHMIMRHLRVQSPDFFDRQNLGTASEKIAKDLNDIFAHEIDPTYEGDQKVFGKTHNSSESGPRPRC